LVEEVWRGRYPTSGPVAWQQWAVAVEAGEAPLDGPTISNPVVYVFGSYQDAANNRRFATAMYRRDGPAPPANHTTHKVALWPTSDVAGLRTAKAMAVVLGSSGHSRVYVTGASPGPNDQPDVVVLAYHADLTLDWMATFDGGGFDTPMAIAANQDYVAVVANSMGTTTGMDLQTLIFRASDGKLMVKTQDTRRATPGADAAADVAIAGGAVYVLGSSPNNDGSGYVRYWTAKYWANFPGQPPLAWATHSGLPNRWHEAADMDIDSGNIYITGTAAPDADFNVPGDYFTVRLNDDGSHFWPDDTNTPSHGYVYDGPAGWHDYAAKVKCLHSSFPDGYFKLYVTGRSRSTSGDFNIVTLKYDDTSYPPQLEWVATLDSLPNTNEYFSGHDGATGLNGWSRIISQGNKRDEIYVSGWRTTASGDTDYFTVKYDSHLPLPGNPKLPRWGIFYPPAPTSPSLPDVSWAQFLPTGPLSDGYINIFVTGQSNGGASGDDFLTIRYRDLDEAP
jgi:hypothetical protein